MAAQLESLIRSQFPYSKVFQDVEWDKSYVTYFNKKYDIQWVMYYKPLVSFPYNKRLAICISIHFGNPRTNIRYAIAHVDIGNDIESQTDYKIIPNYSEIERFVNDHADKELYELFESIGVKTDDLLYFQKISDHE